MCGRGITAEKDVMEEYERTCSVNLCVNNVNFLSITFSCAKRKKKSVLVGPTHYNETRQLRMSSRLSRLRQAARREIKSRLNRAHHLPRTWCVSQHSLLLSSNKIKKECFAVFLDCLFERCRSFKQVAASLVITVSCVHYDKIKEILQFLARQKIEVSCIRPFTNANVLFALSMSLSKHQGKWIFDVRIPRQDTSSQMFSECW